MSKITNNSKTEKVLYRILFVILFIPLIFLILVIAAIYSLIDYILLGENWENIKERLLKYQSENISDPGNIVGFYKSFKELFELFKEQ